MHLPQSQLYETIPNTKLVFTTFIGKKLVLKSINLSTIQKKEKNDKLHLIKIKHFCPLKAHVKGMKRKIKTKRKFFANHVSGKGFVCRHRILKTQ